jgi:hypothetical protein
MPLPNFIMIGAAKSGTSSLFSYLGQHPDVFISSTKEPNFFAFAGQPVAFAGPGDSIINRTSITRREDYEALFRSSKGASAVGEASTLYLYLPSAAPRMHREIPAVRLIAILRDPAERAYSSYLHMVRDGRESVSSFEDALRAEDARVAAEWEPLWHYARLGFYYEQLKRYYDVFPREQIAVCLYDDFEADPKRVVQGIFSFLGVDPAFEPDMSTRHKVAGTPRSAVLHAALTRPNVAKTLAKRLLPGDVRGRLYAALMRRNVVEHRDKLCDDTKQRLRRLYSEDVERLSLLIGRDLSNWLPEVASARD